MKPKLIAALAVAALAPAAFAGCGGDDEDAPSDPAPSSSGSGGNTVKITAAPDGSFAFEESSVETEAGEVTIDFDNPASIPHDVKVEGPDGEIGGTEAVSSDTATATVELEPGDYTFFCSIPGHREGGMEGDLTVD